jgi:hypothetical protein
MEPELSPKLDFSTASERAMRIRAAYHHLEIEHHNGIWTVEEDMLGFVSDVGVLSRLVMAHEGRWTHESDVESDLKHKLSECFWWLLVLSERLDINASEAYTSFVNKLDAKLETSQ